MSILVTQTCDRCNTSRQLRAGYNGQASNFHQAALVGGWREVEIGKHLCADCIKAVLKT